MFNLMVMPASPALAVELSAHDAASRALLAAARTLAVEAAVAGIKAVDIVGSQDKRWYTAHTGSLKAWGAATDLGGGNFLPEIMPGTYCIACRSCAHGQAGSASANLTQKR